MGRSTSATSSYPNKTLSWTRCVAVTLTVVSSTGSRLDRHFDPSAFPLKVQTPPISVTVFGFTFTVCAVVRERQEKAEGVTHARDSLKRPVREKSSLVVLCEYKRGVVDG